jgi:hypothetical protein
MHSRANLGDVVTLVDGSDEIEDVHLLQTLLLSIKTLAEKGLGRSVWPTWNVHTPSIATTLIAVARDALR